MKKYFILILFVMVCGLSCSTTIRSAATSMTSEMAINGMKAIESEGDLYIADQSILPMVKIMEVVGANDPNNEEYNILMAKIYGNVAFGFFETKYFETKGKEKEVWKNRVKKYYSLGSNAGNIAMKARFSKKVDGSMQDFEQAISKGRTQIDLMLLFWTAFNMGQEVNMNRDDVASIAKLPKVDAMINQVLKVDPDYVCGAALAFKAAMLASRPTMLGGKPEEAKMLFRDASSKCEGNYLMNKVLFAEWYAIPQNDRLLAKRLLREVVNSDPSSLPEQALANSLAIKRAKILLKNM